MSLIFQVDKERFNKEFQDRLAANKIENVEWFIDDKGLHAYIPTPLATYYFSSKVIDIPQTILTMLNRKGNTLGLVSMKPKTEIVVEQKPQDFAKIKLQVND